MPNAWKRGDCLILRLLRPANGDQNERIVPPPMFPEIMVAKESLRVPGSTRRVIVASLQHLRNHSETLETQLRFTPGIQFSV